MTRLERVPWADLEHASGAAELAADLGDPNAAADLARALTADAPGMTAHAVVDSARVLRRLGGDVTVVVELAVNALERRQASLQAVQLLAEIGPAAAAAFPVLQRLVTADETAVYIGHDDIGGERVVVRSVA